MTYSFIEYDDNYLICDNNSFSMICKESNAKGSSLEMLYFKSADELTVEIKDIRKRWDRLGIRFIGEGVCSDHDAVIAARLIDSPVTMELPKLELSKRGS